MGVTWQARIDQLLSTDQFRLLSCSYSTLLNLNERLMGRESAVISNFELKLQGRQMLILQSLNKGYFSQHSTKGNLMPTPQSHLYRPVIVDSVDAKTVKECSKTKPSSRALHGAVQTLHRNKF